jgi:hypothetical protein
MDKWTDKQIAIMKLGGNERCLQFLQQHGNYRHDQFDSKVTDSFIQKYDSPAAQLYKQVLIAEYEGKPIPTILPPPRQALSQQQQQQQQQSSAPRRKMEGFGSSPLPSSSDQHDIAKKAGITAVVAVTAAVIIWILVPHS